jgi:hypothetical protein
VDLDGALLAHDAVDSGSSIAVGYRTIAHGTNPTAVAAADRTVAYANRAGIPFVIGGHPNSITREAEIEDGDGAQTGALIVDISAGTKIVVTRLSISCGESTDAATSIAVAFDTDATFPARSHNGTAGYLIGFNGIPAGGGITIGDGSGIIGVGTDGQDLRYTSEDPTGGSCSISVTYYTIDS